MREGRGYSQTDYNASFIGIVPASRPEIVILVTYQKPAYCRSFKLSQETDYPWKGASKITVADIETRNQKPETRNQKPETRNFTLNIRVPGWCVGRPVPSDLYTQTTPGSLADFSVKVNG